MTKKILLVMVLMFAACGGGTSGTGLKQIEGTLKTVEGAPLANTDVVILETGDKVKTDSEGRFSVQTRTDEETINVRIEDEATGLSTDAAVMSVPKGNAGIAIEVAVNAETNSVESVEATITPEEEQRDEENTRGGEDDVVDDTSSTDDGAGEHDATDPNASCAVSFDPETGVETMELCPPTTPDDGVSSGEGREPSDDGASTPADEGVDEIPVEEAES